MLLQPCRAVALLHVPHATGRFYATSRFLGSDALADTANDEAKDYQHGYNAENLLDADGDVGPELPALLDVCCFAVEGPA